MRTEIIGVNYYCRQCGSDFGDFDKKPAAKTNFLIWALRVSQHNSSAHKLRDFLATPEWVSSVLIPKYVVRPARVAALAHAPA